MAQNCLPACSIKDSWLHFWCAIDHCAVLLSYVGKREIFSMSNELLEIPVVPELYPKKKREKGGRRGKHTTFLETFLCLLASSSYICKITEKIPDGVSRKLREESRCNHTRAT